MPPSFAHALIQVNCISQDADALAAMRAVNTFLVATVAGCTAAAE